MENLGYERHTQKVSDTEYHAYFYRTENQQEEKEIPMRPAALTNMPLIDKLTRPIVNELIDSIYVHRDKAITIHFKFTDAYMDMLDYIEAVKQKMADELDAKLIG